MFTVCPAFVPIIIHPNTMALSWVLVPTSPKVSVVTLFVFLNIFPYRGIASGGWYS